MTIFDGPPPEHEGGQDGPPDVRTAIRAVRVLLLDVVDHLDAVEPDGDLLVRVRAHRRALRRVLDHLEES